MAGWSPATRSGGSATPGRGRRGRPRPAARPRQPEQRGGLVGAAGQRHLRRGRGRGRHRADLAAPGALGGHRLALLGERRALLPEPLALLGDLLRQAAPVAGRGPPGPRAGRRAWPRGPARLPAGRRGRPSRAPPRRAGSPRSPRASVMWARLPSAGPSEGPRRTSRTDSQPGSMTKAADDRPASRTRRRGRARWPRIANRAAWGVAAGQGRQLLGEVLEPPRDLATVGSVGLGRAGRGEGLVARPGVGRLSGREHAPPAGPGVVGLGPLQGHRPRRPGGRGRAGSRPAPSRRAACRPSPTTPPAARPGASGSRSPARGPVLRRR